MSKRILILNNAERFVKWINETYPKSERDDRSELQYAAWAICLQEAHSVFDSYNTKDMASLFMEGVTSYASMEAIQSWLDTYYDELNVAIAEGDVKLDVDFCLDAAIAEQWDIGDLEAMIHQDYSEGNDGEEEDE